MWLLVASATNPGVQIATEASSKVNQISAPIIALGVALLALAIVVLVIAYTMSRVPRDS